MGCEVAVRGCVAGGRAVGGVIAGIIINIYILSEIRYFNINVTTGLENNDFQQQHDDPAVHDCAVEQF